MVQQVIALARKLQGIRNLEVCIWNPSLTQLWEVPRSSSCKTLFGVFWKPQTVEQETITKKKPQKTQKNTDANVVHVLSYFQRWMINWAKITSLKLTLLQDIGYFQLPDIKIKVERTCLSCVFFFFFPPISDKTLDEEEWKSLFLKLSCHRSISLECRLKPNFSTYI